MYWFDHSLLSVLPLRDENVSYISRLASLIVKVHFSELLKFSVAIGPVFLYNFPSTSGLRIGTRLGTSRTYTRWSYLRIYNFAETLVCCFDCRYFFVLCRLSRSVISCAYLITPSSLYFFHLSRPFLRYSVLFVGSASLFCLYRRCFSAGVRGIFAPEQQCHNIYIN